MSRTDGGPIRVLHVDDDPDLADASSLYLERKREALTVSTETSATAALARLEETAFDCIVSDYDMPGMDGLAFLEGVRETHPDLPFILFTGKGSEEIASEAISAGVTDYLQKEVGTDQYTVLANRIERAVSATRDEDALAESERMLSTLISNLPGMVYRCENKPGWPMEFVSDGCRNLTGYEPERLESGDIVWGEDILHPEDQGTMWEAVQSALDSGDSFEETYRIHTSDGETRWLCEQGRGVYEGDTLVAIEGFITDISECKAAQQDRQQYETIVRSMDDGAYILDEDGRFEFVNQAFLDASGFERAEIIGEDSGRFAEIADTSMLEDYETALTKLQRGETDELRTEVELTLPERGVRTVNLRLSRLEDDGQFQGIVGITRDITERNAREKELERYQTLVETAGDPMYILDAAGQFTTVNDAFVEKLDQPRSAILGSSIHEFMDEDDIEHGTEMLVEIMSHDDRTAGRFEFTVQLDDRELRIENHHAPLTENGTFVGSVGVIRDITAHKKREQELERYEELVENVGDSMYALDATGTIRMANQAMADHLGYPREDIVGSHVSSFMPEADVETGNEVIASLIDSDDRRWETFEMETVGTDGERKQTEDKIAVLTDEDGEYSGSVGVIRDISDRKEYERELERYETIIQAVGDPVYTLDADGNFTFMNDAIESVTGHNPADLAGEHVSTLMPDEDVETARDLIKTLLGSDTRTNATFEMDLVTQNGTHIPSENHMALLPFEAETGFRGTAGVIRDITERKQREQRLEQFASVVSHDLRNPLNVIKGRTEFAQETGDLDHLASIETAAERMERLIEDLLTLAQNGQTVGETEPVDISTVATVAWEQVETTDATVSVEESLGTVPADRNRLRELFENLFRNAVEHGTTADTDSTTVRVGGITTAENSDAGSPNGIYIADDGPGIPPDIREQVFEHGYTRSPDGTGFGLAIVQNIVEAHGWEISITDSWDAGARIEITALD